MPSITGCPECGRKLRLPDEFIGRKVRCPGCKTVFVAGSGEEAPQPGAAAASTVNDRPTPDRLGRSAAPAADEVEDREPADEREELDNEPLRGRRRHEDDEYGDPDSPGPRGNRAAWRRVLRGLNFVLISIAVAVGIALLLFIGQFVVSAVALSSINSAAPPGPGMPPGFARAGIGFAVMGIIGGVLSAANAVLKVYAHYLGMGVPDRAGGRLRTVAVCTFGLFALWALLSVCGSILTLVTGVGGAFSMNPFASFGGAFATIPLMIGAIVGLLGNLCYLAAFVCFIVYLRGVALAVRRKDVANNAKYFLIILVVMVGLGVLLTAVAVGALGFAAVSGSSPSGRVGTTATTAAIGGGLIVAALGCLGVIGYIGMFIWYLVLLFQVRSAVLPYAGR
jgi:hypothetical protein